MLKEVDDERIHALLGQVSRVRSSRALAISAATL
jgi:hypothetical protein